MSEAPLPFRCPNCKQHLEIEVLPASLLVQCPACGGDVQLEQTTTSHPEVGPSSANPTIANFGRVVLAVSIGAVIVYLLTKNSWLTLVGALLGFLHGQSRNRRAARMRANEDRWQRQQALTGLRSAAISWILLTLMWSWVMTRPRETFHDQGGMLLTFLVYPSTLALWILGGPVAFARGWTNRWRVLTPGVERGVLFGLILSGLLTLAPLVTVSIWRMTS